MRKPLIYMVAVAVLLLASCSNTGGTNEQNSSNEQENTSSNENVNENKGEKTGRHASVDRSLKEILAQFPDEQAEKVITTSVPIAEILHTLDIKPVGVPTSTNPLPEDFAEIAEIGSPMAPDLEKMTDLEAD